MSGRPKHGQAPGSAAEELRTLTRLAHEAAQSVRQAIKEAEAYIQEYAVPALAKDLEDTARQYADPFHAMLADLDDTVSTRYEHVLARLDEFEKAGYTLRMIDNKILPLLDSVTEAIGGSINAADPSTR